MDSARGRLYASRAMVPAKVAGSDGVEPETTQVTSRSGRPSPTPPVELSTYDAETGRRLSTLPLGGGDVLLDVGPSGEFFVLGPDWQIRVLDREAKESRSLPIPTPVWTDTAFQGPFPQKPALPLVDRARGRILAFSGPHVTVFDAETGAITRTFEVPPAGSHGSIVRAALDEPGQTLYLAVGDPALVDWEGAPGVRLMALNWDTLEILDQSELRAELTEWIPTGDGVLASGYSYKQRGSDHRLWKKGLEVARRTEASVRWGAYDQKRNRAVGSVSWDNGNSGRTQVAVADGGRLDLELVTALRVGDLDPFRSGLTAYDPETDQFYGHGQHPDQLAVVPAASVEDSRTAALGDVEEPVTPRAYAWARERSGQPQVIFGTYERPRRLGQPTADPSQFYDKEAAVSTDGGATWRGLNYARTVPGDWPGYWPWPEDIVLSSGFERDRTMFGYKPGYGVFRSTDAGVTWLPASRGMEALYVRDVVLSPNFPADGTLIAIAEDSYRADRDGATAWISRDRGESWSSMGSFTAAAFSPDYARDKRVFAFDHQVFHESGDGGATWQHGGTLGDYDGVVVGRIWVIPATRDKAAVLLALSTNTSEWGGVAHWPESGAEVSTSHDGGLTWTSTTVPYYGLGAGAGTRMKAGLDGHLIGPVGRAGAGVWILQIDAHGDPTWALVTRDGGESWQEVTVPGYVDPDGWGPEAVLMAEVGDSTGGDGDADDLLVWKPDEGLRSGGTDGGSSEGLYGLSTIDIDSLVPVVEGTPTPAAGRPGTP